MRYRTCVPSGTTDSRYTAEQLLLSGSHFGFHLKLPLFPLRLPVSLALAVPPTRWVPQTVPERIRQSFLGIARYSAREMSVRSSAFRMPTVENTKCPRIMEFRSIKDGSEGDILSPPTIAATLCQHS